MKTKNDTLNAIQTMVDSAVNKAGYDKTRNAVILARNANNTYKIKMDGIEYDNVVFYGLGEAQVNEVVKVVIPNNQASQMYVMGKGGGTIASDSNPIGSVIAFAGSNAPVGYLMCDGSAVSRETYVDLFIVIGTTYGSGDGSTTFNLPNAQGRTLVGVSGSDSDFTLGNTLGEKTHTLTASEMPVHTGHVSSSNSGGNWAGKYLGIGLGSSYGTVARGWDNNAGEIHPAGNNAGGGHSHNNIQPSLVFNYIIKATHNVTI